MATPLFFSRFEVTRQAFHRTALAYAIVNLRPIAPGRTCAAPLAELHLTRMIVLADSSDCPNRHARVSHAPRPAPH